MDARSIESHAGWAKNSWIICWSHREGDRLPLYDLHGLSDKLALLCQVTYQQVSSNGASGLLPLEYVRADGSTGCIRLDHSRQSLEWLDRGRFIPLDTRLVGVPETPRDPRLDSDRGMKLPYALDATVQVPRDYLDELERILTLFMNLKTSTSATAAPA